MDVGRVYTSFRGPDEGMRGYAAALEGSKDELKKYGDWRCQGCYLRYRYSD
ncbi:hypothetical protein FRC12_015419 [Ceratobasidium sp. 428]|nr:hypothetical protein FRC12_015419 [Ceratobasidium sp. 428]